MENRFCARDDKPVRQVAGRNDDQARKVLGRGIDAADGKFYHSSGQGPCGKQFLEEHETYTEEDHLSN